MMGLVPGDGTITEAVQRVSLLAGREVEVSILAGGFTNSVFLVRADDERFVFRVPGQASDLLEINRADERYNAQMAARSGVSPDVVDYVEDLQVMVLQFIDGRVPTVEDLQTPDQVRRIATAVRGLHAGPQFNNQADMFSWGKRWLRACESLSISVPDGLHGRLGDLDGIARALAVHPMATVPCHNDLAPYNFIDDGDRLWIIDFEFSGNNDPCFDLAGIVSEAELDEDLCTILLEAYFGEATPFLLARLRLCGVLSDFGWSVYCALQAEVRSDERFSGWASNFWKAVLDVLDGDEMPHLLRTVGRP
jgi:thiamine kinase-like enzyme